MRLHDYLKENPGQRPVIAAAAGVSAGHINNIAYGLRQCAAEIAAQIEQATNQAVMRWDLRPDDWREIWPELSRSPGAPQPEQEAA